MERILSTIMAFLMCISAVVMSGCSNEEEGLQSRTPDELGVLLHDAYMNAYFKSHNAGKYGILSSIANADNLIFRVHDLNGKTYYSCKVHYIHINGLELNDMGNYEPIAGIINYVFDKNGGFITDDKTRDKILASPFKYVSVRHRIATICESFEEYVEFETADNISMGYGNSFFYGYYPELEKAALQKYGDKLVWHLTLVPHIYGTDSIINGYLMAITIVESENEKGYTVETEYLVNKNGAFEKVGIEEFIQAIKDETGMSGDGTKISLEPHINWRFSLY